MTGYEHRFVASVMQPAVNGSYQGWTPCIKWCDQHCQGLWRFVSEGVFEFANEQDYVVFMLKWS